jgi:hypothetical protein
MNQAAKALNRAKGLGSRQKKNGVTWKNSTIHSMKKNNTIDLTIVIVNYNGLILAAQLLPTQKQYYLDQTKRQVEVVVIDNASTDASVDYIQSFDWIHLIRSTYNRGFAAGNNLVLPSITSSYILLLNTDIEWTDQSNKLDELLQYMEDQPQVGMITPKLLLPDGRLDQAAIEENLLVGPPLLTSQDYPAFSLIPVILPLITKAGKTSVKSMISTPAQVQP